MLLLVFLAGQSCGIRRGNLANTVKKAKSNKTKTRHNKTAKNFTRWLAKNPDASLKRQFHAFNSIADSEFNQEKYEKKEKATSKSLVKRI